MQRKSSFKTSASFQLSNRTMLAIPRIFGGLVIIVIIILTIYTFLFSASRNNDDLSVKELVRLNINNGLESHTGIPPEPQVLGVKEISNNFNLTTAKQTRTIGNKIYFLTGNCDTSNGICSVGAVDKSLGKSMIFSSDIASDVLNSSLKNGEIIKISNTQDYIEGVNIIFKSTTANKLIRFNFKDASVAQVLTVTADDIIYNKYFV